MKAKFINEVQNFTQGGDPYQKMNIGKYENNYDWDSPKAGDRIEVIEDIFDTSYIDSKLLNYNGETLVTLSDLRENLLLRYKAGTIFEFDNSDDDYNWFELDTIAAATDDIPGSLFHGWITSRTHYFKVIKNLKK